MNVIVERKSHGMEIISDHLINEHFEDVVYMYMIADTQLEAEPNAANFLFRLPTSRTDLTSVLCTASAPPRPPAAWRSHQRGLLGTRMLTYFFGNFNFRLVQIFN